eukprot:SAG31_NODE_645_length_13244_cov_11.768903_11_plen_95_part_01
MYGVCAQRGTHNCDGLPQRHAIDPRTGQIRTQFFVSPVNLRHFFVRSLVVVVRCHTDTSQVVASDAKRGNSGGNEIKGWVDCIMEGYLAKGGGKS